MVAFKFENIDAADTVIINVDTSEFLGDTLVINKNMQGIGNWDANAGKVLWNFGGNYYHR